MRTEPKPTRLDRIFARLDREPERPVLDVPRMTRHRVVLFGATLAFYIAIVLAVAATTFLVRIDWQAMLFRPYQQWPEIHAFLDYWVVLGQRGPTAVLISAWLGWRSWRQRTLRPLVVFGAALLLLNVTVGAVKYGLGRSGPHYATEVGSNEMWHWFQAGSDIFPSGHTANAVVTWGVLAYLASTPRTRRWLSALSAVLSLSVGLTTVYLGTHWLSDVLLGWAAGLLVLLALPWFEPLISRAESFLLGLRDRWAARRSATAPAAAPAPALARQGTPEGGESEPVRETIPSSAARTAAARTPAYLAPGPHTARSERTPVTPAGSRRPPHPDRVARGTGSPARPLTGG
ncbi:phosphatase PAP2 family protein [Streptomyces sp. enrichment culture]|uniref:phosphatase PAP2 family protein n=1 Tax=Streptomyces sp. enrichment culture TaxID=1795815 RepID=UPI003F57D30E